MSEERESIGTWLFAILFWIVFGIFSIFESLFFLPSGTIIKFYERMDENINTTLAKSILMLLFALLSLVLAYLVYLFFWLIPLL